MYKPSHKKEDQLEPKPKRGVWGRFIDYIRPLIEGRDRRISLRAALAVAFSIDLIRNTSHAVFKWDTGKSFEGLSLVLGSEAGLIIALLGLATIQNIQDRKTDANSDPNNPTNYPPVPIYDPRYPIPPNFPPKTTPGVPPAEGENLGRVPGESPQGE